MRHPVQPEAGTICAGEGFIWRILVTMEGKMRTSGRTVCGNVLAKVVFGLGAALFVFAPPTARAGDAEEKYDFQTCGGYFALCAASPCTPTGREIKVRTATGGTATFPEADCTCPVILGPSIANLAGGNMEGSCVPKRDHIWSTYQPRPNIPQELTNWVPTLPEAAAPPQFCPKTTPPGPEYQLVNCFSFDCDHERWEKNVPVVTCHCPIGESLAGTPIPAGSRFFTQAGQKDPAFCAKYPVSLPLSLP
jgi:hypothetical protein